MSDLSVSVTSIAGAVHEPEDSLITQEPGRMTALDRSELLETLRPRASRSPQAEKAEQTAPVSAPVDHAGSTMSFRPDPSRAAPNADPGTVYIYMNGMLTDDRYARRDGQAAADAFGREVLVVHNQSDSGLTDGFNAAVGALSRHAVPLVEREASERLLEAVRRQLDEGKRVHLILHSQGTEIGGYVLAQLTPEQRSRIDVSSFGAANHSWPHGLSSVTEYKNGFDFVQIGTTYLDHAQSQVRFERTTPVRELSIAPPIDLRDGVNGPLHYHSFPTYMQDLPSYLVARAKTTSTGGAEYDDVAGWVRARLTAAWESFGRTTCDVDSIKLARELHSSISRGEFSSACYHNVVDRAIRGQDYHFAKELLRLAPDGQIGEFQLREDELESLRSITQAGPKDAGIVARAIEGARVLATNVAEITVRLATNSFLPMAEPITRMVRGLFSRWF